MGRTPALLAALLVAAVAVHGQAPTTASDKPRLAVLKLEARGMVEEGEAATEELRKAFVKSGRYTVVDRSLTDQILKEWETQQSGVTDTDRAVRVGKLFNVKLIVAGRINRIGNEGWQVSAAMLDAESGITQNAETIRHQGDIFGLINDKIPTLAGMLAGEQAAAKSPASMPAAVAPAAPAPGGKKLAIFPALFQGQNAKDFLRGRAPADAAITKALDQDHFDLKVTHQLSDNELLGKDVWSGIMNKEPDLDAVLKRARDLGVSLVLMYQSRSDPGGIEYNLYLIDTENLRQYHRKGTWTPGPNPRGWVPTLGRAANALAIERKLTQASRWPNPAAGTRVSAAELQQLFSRSVTLHFLVAGSAGTVEYLPGGTTKVRHPAGEDSGKWRQDGDTICTTSSWIPGAKESCTYRYKLAEGLYRVADGKGTSLAIVQVKR